MLIASAVNAFILPTPILVVLIYGYSQILDTFLCAQSKNTSVPGGLSLPVKHRKNLFCQSDRFNLKTGVTESREMCKTLLRSQNSLVIFIYTFAK